MPRQKRAEFLQEVERIEQALTQLLEAERDAFRRMMDAPLGPAMGAAVSSQRRAAGGTEEGGRSPAEIPREEFSVITSTDIKSCLLVIAGAAWDQLRFGWSSGAGIPTGSGSCRSQPLGSSGIWLHRSVARVICAQKVALNAVHTQTDTRTELPPYITLQYAYVGPTTRPTEVQPA
jgi:hypothetical protein